MKKKISLIVLTFGLLSFAGDYPHPRYTQNGYEIINNYYKKDTTIETFHDKESGVEFICVSKSVEDNGSHASNIGSISCFLTGRNWKN